MLPFGAIQSLDQNMVKLNHKIDQLLPAIQRLTTSIEGLTLNLRK